ncbi:Protease 4 [Vibrio aerogenes CECT 7868]|uniref:Protease 4 n=1 Tax=Vibrio aerogenes CECT 7868 TaxID=1216006 RepID=A0A1M6BS00_9VIBR|nr:signal peptide peptidase SppA [Vibrio aerogenes]SHI51467.1 Protease 4 [Vibrio aerogenes CECT 7868]
MKAIFKFIGTLFKWIWKCITFIRVTLMNLVFLILLLVIYGAYLQSVDETEVSAPRQPSALVLNLSGPIVEKASYLKPIDSISHSVLGESLPKENVLFDIVDTIRHAKDDKQITGLVLSLQEMSATNLTKLRYIAKAINEFKSSGKMVFAVGDIYTQSQYYLASYADKIYMSPDGLVMLKGYSAYGMYYKTLLDKLDINTHIFRVGTYKSAVEPFIRNDMSEAARRANYRWVNQLWDGYLKDVATNRRISKDDLNLSMDEFLSRLKYVKGDVARLSRQMGLVDELLSRKAIRDKLAQIFGSDGKDGYMSVDYYDYQASLPQKVTYKNNQIAVVVASGTIMDGKQSQRNVIGSENITALLREARMDDQVKAVVLRVDSPGGSAFASEVIRNEIDALKEAGKPVVVSMSSLAASGGYWISSSADKIIAQPTTLTGSIGIFSVITTFEKSLDRIGVSTDGVGTTPFSGQGVVTGFSDGAKKALQMTIEHGYHRFISLVADHRHMTLPEADKIAQGRVWTGKDALDNGLVDQLGDFDDAVRAAAELAKLKPHQYQLDWMEEPLSPMEKILMDVVSETRASLGLNIESLVPESLRPVTQQMISDSSFLNALNDPRGQYAFCLNCQVK